MAQKPRAIFEEVQTTTKIAAAETGVIDRTAGGARGAIRMWLAGLFALVLCMIALGGLTRLTDSGLSITEWAPFSGALPPMNAQDWAQEFEKYQQIPEFKEQNSAMDLAGFKQIYWWEWSHRQLGRVIGLVWALGFFSFLIARKIPQGWTGRLLILGALGGLQGAIGWWMVSSGLKEGMLDVASYRLAIHLGLAFVILGLIAWYILRLDRREAALLQARRSSEAKLFSMSTGLMHFAFLQILLGALVAGIDAGRAFPTWPLMGTGFLPPEPFGLTPLWRNFFEDAGLVQFMHRISGYGLFAFGLVVWRRGAASAHSRTRRVAALMGALLTLQVVLGILTVLYSAPWQLGIAHQIAAVVLWSVILSLRFFARYPVADKLRA